MHHRSHEEYSARREVCVCIGGILHENVCAIKLGARVSDLLNRHHFRLNDEQDPDHSSTLASIRLCSRPSVTPLLGDDTVRQRRGAFMTAFTRPHHSGFSLDEGDKAKASTSSNSTSDFIDWK